MKGDISTSYWVIVLLMHIYFTFGLTEITLILGFDVYASRWFENYIERSTGREGGIFFAIVYNNMQLQRIMFAQRHRLTIVFRRRNASNCPPWSLSCLWRYRQLLLETQLPSLPAQLDISTCWWAQSLRAYALDHCHQVRGQNQKCLCTSQLFMRFKRIAAQANICVLTLAQGPVLHR